MWHGGGEDIYLYIFNSIVCPSVRAKKIKAATVLLYNYFKVRSLCIQGPQKKRMVINTVRKVTQLILRSQLAEFHCYAPEPVAAPSILVV